jgi:hypothetical protein
MEGRKHIRIACACVQCGGMGPAGEGGGMNIAVEYVHNKCIVLANITSSSKGIGEFGCSIINDFAVWIWIMT